jgi:hypothetical protein
MDDPYLAVGTIGKRKVYLFKRINDGNVTKIADIGAPISYQESNTDFGANGLALKNTSLAIGSQNEADKYGNGPTGSVYIYNIDDNDTVNLKSKFIDPYLENSADFGSGIALSDRYIAVGAQREDGTNSDGDYLGGTGGVYLYDLEDSSDVFLGKKLGVADGYFWEFYNDNLLVMTRDWYPNVPLQTAKYKVINNNELNITWDNNGITDNVVFDDGLKVDSNFTVTGSDVTYGSATFTIPEVGDINASGFGFTKEMLCGEGDFCFKTFYIIEEYPEGRSYLDSMEISATDMVYTEFPHGCTETSCSQDYSWTYDYNITNGKLNIVMPGTDTSSYTLIQANNHAHNKYGYYNAENIFNSYNLNVRFYEDKDEAIKYLNSLNGL